MSDLTVERIAEMRDACIEIADRTDEIERLRAERDRYHDAIVARHGGEPVALLAELDAARARLKLITDRLAEFSDWRPEAHSPECDPREAELCEWHNRLLMAVRQVCEIATEADR